MLFISNTLSGGSLEEAGPLHSPVCLTFCFQEDTRARQQRLQKHLAEYLRQTWGQLGPPPQARDLKELLQAWGAGARTGASKGSRFTHSEKFTFHLVGGLEWTWGVLTEGTKADLEGCFMYKHHTLSTQVPVFPLGMPSPH